MGAKNKKAFGGYATKYNIKCTDGRTIKASAFNGVEGNRYPLVWRHGSNDPDNVLGHVIVHERPDGLYVDGYFNSTARAQTVRTLLEHSDIEALSIRATNLVEKIVGTTKEVVHGLLNEVSFVMAGANPGALIDFVAIEHSDGSVEELSDEALIYSGVKIDVELEHEKDSNKSENDGPTVQDVYDSLTEEQQSLLSYMIEQAIAGQMEQSAESDETKPNETGTDESDNVAEHQKGELVTKNVFEGDASSDTKRPSLSHEAVASIFDTAKRLGSMKMAVQEYALEHGIDNLDVLFPDAKAITDRPDWDKRRTEWVAGVISGTHKTPFSRIKTLIADLTQDEARAKGYIKGELKKEEYFGIVKRTTGPTTVYKKQKLDRDDIIDITDFDVVAWMWGEIRLMLEEEVARAVLIGDGRDVEDTDHIADPIGASSGNGIRSVLNDHDYYAMKVYVNLGDLNSSYLELVDAIIDSRRFYKGTGLPTFYTTETVIASLLTLRDSEGRRIYRTLDEVAAELRVAAIVPVEPMEDVSDLLGIMVNLTDYNIGTTRGGEITNFDDFDLDYNKYTYLSETRLSGALIKARSALVFMNTTSTNVLATPSKPTFVASTGVITIPTVTGVVYTDEATGDELEAGVQDALAAGASMIVKATPDTGYYLANTPDSRWTFTRNHA